ncbi:hypothetical protein CERSUDRAFT_119706 [Gelatoporia subvermispora B]|uniref:C2H2-type domain-containing protein n=1 Tax=Ceriporiopsis subvermispora (strain B) TaxID=914234 RepID=M2QZT6_CERS8|nr:hypothetical protein CERSUDRAFT_119706 [Gelatoporia subvermispora B]
MSMRPRPQTTHGGRTPAQEIAARYRATHVEKDKTRGRRPSYTGSAQDGRTGYYSWRVGESSSPRVRVRFSQVDAMEDARREAYGMMLRGGHGNYDIMCDRPGCGNVLRDLQALAAHLHLHNIENQYQNRFPPYVAVSQWPSRPNHRRSQYSERYPSADLLARRKRRTRIWDKLARWSCVRTPLYDD